MHENMYMIAEEGEEQVVFFFAPKVDFDTMTVEGHTYSKKNGWRRGIHEIPKCIFNNAITSHEPSLETIRQFRQLDWYMFNQLIANKWRMTKVMRRWQPLAPHIPDTDFLVKPEEIDVFLSKYPAVYIKPLTGSGGRGIMRVQWTEDKTHYQITGDTEAVMTRDEFYPFIKKCLEQTYYIYQQEVPLMSVDDRKIDLRVFVVLDGEKQWRAISTVAKLGADDKIVTNLAAGGEMRSYDWLANEAKKQGIPMPTQEQIEQVAISAGDSISPDYPKVTHLGIDVALDTNGNLWMLDLNPSPTRKTLSEAQKRQWYRYMVDLGRTISNEK
jgi:glutathione synthase/RimK-type ligase-like ATP-grasp enzyme